MNFSYDLLVHFHFEWVKEQPKLLENPTGLGIYIYVYVKFNTENVVVG